MIEYAIARSDALRDRHWEGALNALHRIPSSGRLLKVAYKRLSKDRVKIITAMWPD